VKLIVVPPCAFEEATLIREQGVADHDPKSTAPLMNDRCAFAVEFDFPAPNTSRELCHRHTIRVTVCERCDKIDHYLALAIRRPIAPPGVLSRNAPRASMLKVFVLA
jgi:hypothetical protein